MRVIWPTGLPIPVTTAPPISSLLINATLGFTCLTPRPDYAAQIQAQDRWAIVAYLRALQLSQNTKVEALSADERKKLESGEGNTKPQTEKGERHQ